MIVKLCIWNRISDKRNLFWTDLCKQTYQSLYFKLKNSHSTISCEGTAEHEGKLMVNITSVTPETDAWQPNRNTLHLHVISCERTAERKGQLMVNITSVTPETDAWQPNRNTLHLHVISCEGSIQHFCQLISNIWIQLNCVHARDRLLSERSFRFPRRERKLFRLLTLDAVLLLLLLLFVCSYLGYTPIPINGDQERNSEKKCKEF